MDTEKCRVLLTVLHERSLSAAAEALGYTPSGISRLVDSLERETGFPLLHRGRGGVSATRACQELLPLMRRMAELDEQYQQLATEGSSGYAVEEDASAVKTYAVKNIKEME